MEKDRGDQNNPLGKTFVKFSDPYRVAYQPSAYLDMEEVEREMDRLQNNIAGLENSFRAFQLRIRLPLSDEEKKHCEAGEIKFRHALHLMKLNEDSLPADNVGGETTYYHWNLNRAKGFGLNLIIARALDAQTQVFYAYSPIYSIPALNERRKFLFAGPLVVHHGPAGAFSLEEIFDGKTKSTPATFFYYLNDSFSMRARATFAEDLPHNTDPLMVEHPNLVKDNLAGALAMVNACLSLPSSELDSAAKKHSGIEREAFLAAKKMGERLKHAQSQIYQTLLDPTSPHFSDLKTAIASYLTQDYVLATWFTMYTLGLTSNDALCHTFRQCQQFIDQDQETEFYQLFSQRLEEFVATTAFGDNILLEEDLGRIINENGVSRQDPVPSFADLGRLVKQIFSLGKLETTIFEPHELDWQGFLPTPEASLTYNQTQPQNFKISLTFEDRDGDKTDLAVSFDCKKETFDWSLLPSPNTPRLEYVRQQAFRLAYSMLKRTLAWSQEKQSLRRQKTAPALLTHPSPKREHCEDEIYKLRKETRNGSGHNAQPPTSPNETKKNAAFHGTRQIKNIIVLPPSHIWEEMLRKLHPVDRGIITQKVYAFNERGVGRFKSLNGRTADGALKHVFVAGCTVPCGARIVLDEIESEEAGVRLHTPREEVEYRKDSYRNYESLLR